MTAEIYTIHSITNTYVMIVEFNCETNMQQDQTYSTINT